jgi:hypothetical protein
MTVAALLGEKRGDVLRIAAKYGARRVRVFGSLARGEPDARSDVDFLVDLEAGRSLLDLGGPQYELESLLHRPVDVVRRRREISASSGARSAPTPSWPAKAGHPRLSFVRAAKSWMAGLRRP